MRRMRMSLWTALVSCLLAGFGTVSGASAADFSGTLTIGSTPACDFVMDTTNVPAPPGSQTMLGATFAGDPGGPSNNPCDPTSVSPSDINVSFSIDGAHFDATLGSFTIVMTYCNYTAGSGVILHGGPNIYGAYGPSGFTMYGSPSFLCLPLSFTLENLLYNP